jgi:plastocyanin
MVFLRTSGLAALLCVLYIIFGNERAGFILFGAIALAALGAAIIVILAYQDEAVVLEAAPEGPPVSRPVEPAPLPARSLTPIGAAAATTLVLTGAVYGESLVIFGLVVALITTVGWTVVAASEHRGAPINLLPLSVPIAAFAAIAAFMFFMSRLLLAVSEQASIAVGIGVAMLILAGGFLVANKPAIPKRTLVRALVLAAFFFGIGGVAAYAAGQRHIESHGGAEPETVVAKDIKFDQTHLEWEAGAPVAIDFKNEDTVPHNIHFATDDTYTTTIYKKDPLPGPIEDPYRFEAPRAGDYVYRCDVHPNMVGTVAVTGEGGAAPGTATTTTFPGMFRPASGGGSEHGSESAESGEHKTDTTEAKKTTTTRAAAAPGTSADLEAKGLEFAPKTLSFKGNSDVVIHFDNQDPLPHDVDITTEEDGQGREIFVSEPFTGPKKVDYRFRTPGPGRLFFRCSVHPNMKGTINVT